MITFFPISATAHATGTAGKHLPCHSRLFLTPGGPVTLPVPAHCWGVHSALAEPIESTSGHPRPAGNGSILAMQSLRLNRFLVNEYQCVATLCEILFVVGDQI